MRCRLSRRGPWGPAVDRSRGWLLTPPLLLFFFWLFFRWKRNGLPTIGRVCGFICRYFIYLLSNRKLLLALHLATEVRSRELCQALTVAASAIGGDRANFVSIIANQALEMTTPSSVSFV